MVGAVDVTKTAVTSEVVKVAVQIHLKKIT